MPLLAWAARRRVLVKADHLSASKDGENHHRESGRRLIPRLMDQVAGVTSLFIVIAAFAFLLLPLLVTTVMAFDARGYLGPMPPTEYSLRWFERFFTEPMFIDALGTTVLVAMVSVSIALVAGVTAAVFLDRHDFAGKDGLVAFLMSPLMVPPVVIGFAMLLFLSQVGVIDGFARLVLGHVILTTPYTVRATLAGLVGIDRTLTEAALSLGSTEVRAFMDITLPLAKTGIIAGAIFGAVMSLDDIAIAVFLVDPSTKTLPVALLSSMRAEFDLTIAAAAVFLIALTIALILVLDRTVGLNRVVGLGVYSER